MKYILSIVTCVVSLVASAQGLPNMTIGAIQNGGAVEIVAEPTSTIIVDLTISTTTFTAGIYSRYAQKYLGERAQLTDKTSTAIESSQLSIAPEDLPIAKPKPASTIKKPTQKLAIDRTSSEVMIPELAAQNAANQIFANRRICRDLIAGDVGEGVFGEGLQTALDRFDKMESEYLALFMGEEQIETTTHRLFIPLTSDNTRFMVGRFDSRMGLLPANEIEGEPIYLQITPSEVSDSTYLVPGSRGSARRVFIVPNMSQCDLYVGTDIINSTILPLYTYGSRATLLYDSK